MHLHFLPFNGNALYPRLVSIFNGLYKFSRKYSNVLPRDEQIFRRSFNISNRKYLIFSNKFP